jgi:integrase
MACIRNLPDNKYRTEIRKFQKTIITKTFTSRADAEAWGKDLDSKVNQILSIKPSKRKKLSPNQVEQLGGLDLFRRLGVEVEFMFFKDLANEYMLQWTGKDKNQIYRAAYWLDIFGDTPIKSIKQKHVRKAIKAFASEYKKDGAGRPTKQIRSSNTVIRYKAVLSAIFKYAIQEGYTKLNPVIGVYVKAEPNKRERFLSDKERNKLLSVAKKSSWKKLHLLILMAITTGMRKSELLYLRWRDIDFARGLAKLEDTKNGESRTCPIPAPALEELKQYRQVGNGYVFNSPQKPDRPFEFAKQWRNALIEAKLWMTEEEREEERVKLGNEKTIDNFRFHDLRHTAASYFMMGGATLLDTAKILGHKTTTTTERYAHLETEHISAVAGNAMIERFSKK